MTKAMVQLNSNLLCAVEVLTTGPTPNVHDIFQISIVPLDNFYKPLKAGIMPFSTTLRPHDPTVRDRSHISELEMAKATRGLEPFTACDIFQRWFQKWELPEGKKLQVISYDWPTKAKFLEAWLQPDIFHEHFHEWYRDLLPVSMYLNDCAEMNIEAIPFPKNKFTFICSRLNLPFTDRNDSLENAVQIAAAYERILKKRF